MKFVNENKWFVASFLVWLFIHLTLFLISNGEPYYRNEGFWPFNRKLDIDAYDYVELFVYVVFPLLIFSIYKLVGKDIISTIDENK